MANTLNKLAQAVVAGMPRRHVLKSLIGVGVGAVVGGSGFGRRTTLRAFESEPRVPGKGRPAVSLMVRLPDNTTPILTLGDRGIGRVSYNGEQLGLLPQIWKPTRTVELSVYRGSKETTTFAKRLSLPLYKKRKFARLTDLDLDFMGGGVAVAALAHDDFPMLSNDGPDCTVYCCNGSQLTCDGACCCSATDPSCGSCCDAGHCPGCS